MALEEEGNPPSTRTSLKRQLLQLLTLYYWLIWGLLSLKWHNKKDVTAQINTYCLAIDVSATLNNNSCVNNHLEVVQDTNYWKADFTLSTGQAGNWPLQTNLESLQHLFFLAALGISVLTWKVSLAKYAIL